MIISLILSILIGFEVLILNAKFAAAVQVWNLFVANGEFPNHGFEILVSVNTSDKASKKN